MDENRWWPWIRLSLWVDRGESAMRVWLEVLMLVFSMPLLLARPQRVPRNVFAPGVPVARGGLASVSSVGRNGAARP